MAKNLSNAVRKYSEESLEEIYPSKQNLPCSTPPLIFEGSEDRARDILINSGERGKYWVDRLDVSKGQVSQWMSGQKIPEDRCRQIISIYRKEIRVKHRSLDERVEAWQDNIVWSVFGAN